VRVGVRARARARARAPLVRAAEGEEEEAPWGAPGGTWGGSTRGAGGGRGAGAGASGGSGGEGGEGVEGVASFDGSSSEEWVLREMGRDRRGGQGQARFRVRDPLGGLREDPSERPLRINLDMTLHRAKRHLLKGERAEAVRWYEQCRQGFPEDGRAWVALGRLAWEREGDVERARALFEEGSAACAGANPYIYQAWATLEVRQGNSARARVLFDAATAADKTHAASWHAWAALERREGNLGKARSLLLKGLQANKGNGFLWQGMALMERDAGNLDDARACFRSGLEVEPKSAALWAAWAAMEQHQGGDPARAMELYSKGLEASPKNRYCWLALASLTYEKRSRRTGRKMFAKAMMLNPGDAALPQAWAVLEGKAGNAERARQIFDECTQRHPRHLPAWQAWGVMERRCGNLDKARELFQAGIWADPSQSQRVAEIFHAWAMLESDDALAVETYKVDEARELFACAARADPGNIPVWNAWASFEERLGSSQRGRALRRQEGSLVAEQLEAAANAGGKSTPLVKKLSMWVERNKSVLPDFDDLSGSRERPGLIRAEPAGPSDTAA